MGSTADAPSGLHASTGEPEAEKSWPAVGETVHFVGLQNECYAAIVTQHSEGTRTSQGRAISPSDMDLTVLAPGRLLFKGAVQFSEDRVKSTWHWTCGR